MNCVPENDVFILSIKLLPFPIPFPILHFTFLDAIKYGFISEYDWSINKSTYIIAI